MICACSLTEVQRLKPPAVLLLDCPTVAFTGQTYGDLVQHAISLKEAIDLCNQDKAALRKWATAEKQD